MNEKEIKSQIKKEKGRIKRLERQIKDIEFDIDGTKKAIEFWEEILIGINKGK